MEGDYAKEKCVGTKLDEIVPASEMRRGTRTVHNQQ